MVRWRWVIQINWCSQRFPVLVEEIHSGSQPMIFLMMTSGGGWGVSRCHQYKNTWRICRNPMYRARVSVQVLPFLLWCWWLTRPKDLVEKQRMKAVMGGQCQQPVLARWVRAVEQGCRDAGIQALSCWMDESSALHAGKVFALLL